MPRGQAAPALLALEEIHIDRDHVVGTWRNMLICVWRHQTEERAILNLRPVIDALKAANPTGIGMLTVVEPDADMPSAGARRELPLLLKQVAKGVACSALVFEGVGFRAAAIRALTTTFNMLAAQPFPHKVFSSIGAAETMYLELLPMSANGERLARGELEGTVSAFRANLDAWRSR